MEVEAPYRALVAAALPRLWQQIDLDPSSPTRGEADRLHWAWGARDLANADLQRAAGILAGSVRLGLLEEVRVASAREALVRRWMALQHADGTFDQWFPFEHSLGTAAFTLAEIVPAAGSLAADAEFRAVVRRSAEAIAEGEESHGFISNHRGGMALALMRAADLLQEPRFAARAGQIIEGILERQSSEGWFAEYDGADPGYETLGLSYLAQCWQISGERRILEACRRSLAFLVEVQHPDGAMGGDYGSRGVALLFPAGLEILAPVCPEAAWLARGARAAFLAGRTPAPVDLDDANFVAVLSNVTTAAIHAARIGESARRSTGHQQASSNGGWRSFPGAGLARFRAEAQFALVSTSRLGAGVFHAGERAFCQSGYVGRHEGRTIVTTIVQEPDLLDVQSGVVEVEGAFHEVALLPATPFRHVALRAAFLLAGLVPGLRMILKRLLAGRLIARRIPVPVRLRRRIRVSDRFLIEDLVTNASSSPVTLSPAERCVPFYMGSARYRPLADGVSPGVEFTLAPGESRELRHEF